MKAKILCGASLVLSLPLASCASSEIANIQADTLYINAVVYADAIDRPVDAFAVADDRIVFAGSYDDAKASVTAQQTIDLDGQFVLPGLIDSHAHPGLVALIGEVDGADEALPTDSKDHFFQVLRQYAVTLRDEPIVVLGSWDVAMFLPKGPHRKDLDEIFPDQPVVLTDNSGHSTWLNSAALAMFGVDESTPDMSTGVSMFVRDESGEPTGWVKEFALMRELGEALLRPRAETKTRLQTYLNYLSEHGVTTVWDAGNFANDDFVYSVLSEMDQEGSLPVRYEGSYHIFDPAQLQNAASELMRLREQYAGERLKFNSIKVHYDGVVEVGTAGMLEPYQIGPENYGGFLFDAVALAALLVELDDQDIDVHLHSVGDAATREILDAVQMVKESGRDLRIEVTISHLEHVDADDFPRFAKLGVHANFTPHWWGGTYFGGAGELFVGEEMLHASQPGGSLFEQGANVTFSSDVTTLSAMHRANPFLGMQMAVTRQEFNQGPDAPMFGLAVNRVNRQQAIAAYTLNGARQLGQEQAIGSIQVGKKADFIVLRENLLDVDAYQLQHLKPAAVFLGGDMVAGSQQ